MGNRKNSSSKARAAVITDALRQVLLEEIDSKAKKEQLATFMGLSVAGVEALLYLGKGSVSSWINAFLYRFQLDEKQVVDGLKNFSREVRRNTPTRESDQLWFALDEPMSEEDKVFWANLIQAAADLKSPSATKRRRR